MDVPCNLQRVVENSTTRWRHQPIIPHLLQRVVECSQRQAFFSTMRCSVSYLQRVVDRLSVINDWHIVNPPRPLTLQRVVEKKACHSLHSTTRCRIITTRCRLHGTSTTACHSTYPLCLLTERWKDCLCYYSLYDVWSGLRLQKLKHFCKCKPYIKWKITCTFYAHLNKMSPWKLTCLLLLTFSWCTARWVGYNCIIKMREC